MLEVEVGAWIAAAGHHYRGNTGQDESDVTRRPGAVLASDTLDRSPATVRATLHTLFGRSGCTIESMEH